MKAPVQNPILLVVAMAVLGSLPTGRAAAQTFTTLHKLAGSEGIGPNGLVSSGTVLYGTAGRGGGSGNGSVFRINTDGSGLEVLHNFSALASGGSNYDGMGPQAGLILSNNVLFGTAIAGGSSGNGTVFALNIDGTDFKVLHNFSGVSEGSEPEASLILLGDTLYGTTPSGGVSGNGTVFAVNTDGTGFTNLYTFSANIGDVSGNPINVDGASPFASLIVSGTTLYGTTYSGGNAARGTVFKINTDGTGFSTLHSFNSDEAGYPTTPLLLSGNTLYGASSWGPVGRVFSLSTDGRGFVSIFTNAEFSKVSLIAYSANTLYGLSAPGLQAPPNSSLFKINTDGTEFSTLFSFDLGDYVHVPAVIPTQNGFFGTTPDGGASGVNIVFSLLFTPQMAIASSRANIILSWPTNYAGFDYSGYHLQSTTNLTSPLWATTLSTPVVVNGQNTVTNPNSGILQFFRLSE
jgi:uncharacterized repeat protein (TIGR03803 family)